MKRDNKKKEKESKTDGEDFKDFAESFKTH